MARKSKAKRQHYVPRLYLVRFGRLLYVFDKKTGKTFSSTPSNIALESGFYDLAPEIDLEGLIAKNEARLNPGLSELVVKGDPTAISTEARAKVSLFIALQYIRTREARLSIQEMAGKFLTAVVNEEPRFKGHGFKVTMDEEAAQAMQATAIVDDTVPKLASFIDGSLWVLLINESTIPFWTSDNPVALFNPIDYGTAGGLGFGAKGIQTHFPLSSDLSLVILDPTSYKSLPIMSARERVVLEENERQLYNATRFVFSSKNDFALAKRLWENDKSLREPHARVSVHVSKGERGTLFQTSSLPSRPLGKK